LSSLDREPWKRTGEQKIPAGKGLVSGSLQIQLDYNRLYHLLSAVTRHLNTPNLPWADRMQGKSRQFMRSDGWKIPPIGRLAKSARKKYWWNAVK